MAKLIFARYKNHHIFLLVSYKWKIYPIKVELRYFTSDKSRIIFLFFERSSICLKIRLT